MTGDNLDLFVPELPVERKVKIGGKERIFWFREVSDADWYRYVAARQSDDVDAQAGARAFLISKSLCEPDGRLSLTLELAATLRIRPASAFEKVILALDREASDDAGKESAPGATETGSGTS